MQVKVKLSEIINGMDFGGEESGYLHKKTGQIVMMNDDDLRAAEDNESLEDLPDWQQEAIQEALAFINNKKDYLPLPTRQEINEYKIMKEFCLSVPNEQISSVLLRAIQGSGAFWRFKDFASQEGIIDEWYRYRDRALKEFAMQWCKDNQVDYIDDVVIPDEKQIQAEKKAKQYAELEKTLRESLKDESDLITNAANTAALIYHTLPDVNWAGFYFLKGDQLVLGPFQGKPACTRIAVGKGVCGTAVAQRKTLVVPDVSQFPSHITCDAASKSEIVVPLIIDNELLGVLDIDSTKLNRFDAQDQYSLERLIGMFVDKILLP